ncbi:hypothetical protein FEM03_00825 [Phragmitibacter flavus]|uniref:Uncharacterized protein n=1 Tax=Phragmitibacter flavus TaxID=2576071 RepID=A0A5R8KK73_9BACT|nr:hypothetical protein [Phragmitibacter flavus]TLD72650.1 hypothetical protein FEM03_00825 [Phragmitibacter flavus]
MKALLVSLILWGTALVLSATAQSVEDPTKIPVYVTPFYNSKGPKIEVGEFSAGLASKDEKTFVETIKKMRQNWDRLSFESMYVAAVRLYDLGFRDESVYWFYSAQYRGRLFGVLVDPASAKEMGQPGFERVHAHRSFFQLTGPYFNGYAFRDVAGLANIVRKVQKEGATPPDLQAAYPGIKFREKSAWDAANQGVNKGMTNLIDMLRKDRENIKKQRVASGVEAKFSELTSRELPMD